MDFLFPLAAAIFGAIIGSFLNAFTSRFNTGQGMGGRSHCDRCGHTLFALDLIPIFSYLFLGGRCRYCRAKISIQNPTLEITTALISFLIYLRYPIVTETGITMLPYFFWLFVWATLLFVVTYDMKHTIIPWSCSIMLAALALFSLYFSFTTYTMTFPDTWALLSGPLLALPLFLLSLVSGGRWMGWADSGLELSLGWFLGISLGASALMLSFWSGAITGVLLLLFSRVPWMRRFRKCWDMRVSGRRRSTRKLSKRRSVKI